MALIARKRPDDVSAAHPAQLPFDLPELGPLDTLERIHAALADLDTRRLASQAVIDGEAAAEAKLIDADAPDQQFATLTMRTRQARRLLVKLDRREREILDAAQAVEDARRLAVWTDLKARYTAAAHQAHEYACLADRWRLEVALISRAAAQAGFGAAGSQALPYEPGLFPTHLFTVPADASRRLPETPPGTGRPGAAGLSLGQTSMVEIVAPFGSYVVGEIYSVAIERAAWLVQQGVAQHVRAYPFGTGPVRDETVSAEPDRAA